MKKGIIYMAVEDDKYELPIAVADSAGELALMVGIAKTRIFEEMSRAKRAGVWCRFIKVPEEGDFVLPTKRKEKKEPGRRALKVIHLLNGEEIIYENTAAAADAVGVSKATIKRWIKVRKDWEYEGSVD